MFIYLSAGSARRGKRLCDTCHSLILLPQAIIPERSPSPGYLVGDVHVANKPLEEERTG